MKKESNGGPVLWRGSERKLKFEWKEEKALPSEKYPSESKHK